MKAAILNDKGETLEIFDIPFDIPGVKPPESVVDKNGHQFPYIGAMDGIAFYQLPVAHVRPLPPKIRRRK